MNTSEDDMLILMSHRPIDTQLHADKGVSLQLSGHTHGGQIVVELAHKNNQSWFFKGVV
ncbi:hypothetical protein OURE66S_03740 [Oligella ureolytica]